MPLTKGFIYKELAGEYMLIPMNGMSLDMSKVFNLNEVGACIYKALVERDDISYVAEKLTQEYSVDYKTALADVEEFIEALRKRGIYA